MNVYVETNFLLELTFEQEQRESCERILFLCQTGTVRLLIPAYCFVEAQEKVRRQANLRTELYQTLQRELRLLSRTGSYGGQINILEIASLWIQSIEDEKERFERYRKRIMGMAEILPLTHSVLETSQDQNVVHDLPTVDALMYSSVITHLHEHQPGPACFLNRNARDFDTVHIRNALESLSCRLITSFDDGLRFIQAHAA